MIVPVLIPGRAVDGVILARPVFQRETPRVGLLVEWIRSLRRRQLAGRGTALGADYVLHSGQRRQVAEFGRVDDVRGRYGQFVPGAQIAQCHGFDLVPTGVRRSRRTRERRTPRSTGARRVAPTGWSAGQSVGSVRTTRRPSRTAASAAATPPRPPPTTSTSVVSSSRWLVRVPVADPPVDVQVRAKSARLTRTCLWVRGRSGCSVERIPSRRGRR